MFCFNFFRTYFVWADRPINRSGTFVLITEFRGRIIQMSRNPSLIGPKPMPDIMHIRAQAKARARARDEERLRAGEISPRELQQENLAFRGFRKGVIGFGPKLKPKSAERVAV